jgi:uncharacterized lipoprotein NlpE involved in copper resistance
MKKRNLIQMACVLFLAVTFFACNPSPSTNANSDAKDTLTEGNSVANTAPMLTKEQIANIAGAYHYEGACADCEGFVKDISLYDDMKFDMFDTHLNKSKNDFHGTWTAENDLLLLNSNAGVSKFQIKEGSLLVLDSLGKPVTPEILLNKVIGD